MVGAPKAPCDQPLQVSQVQGAVGQVWEGVGVHPCDLQVWGGGSEDKVQVQGSNSTSYPCLVCSSPALGRGGFRLSYGPGHRRPSEVGEGWKTPCLLSLRPERPVR